MSALKIGDVVERYVVEAILGSGGVATVYLVRHRQLDSLYALKYLHLDHPKLRERMLQEGRLQATLQHPNIVSVHDVLDVNDAPGLLMEYISGGSLEELIDYEEISVGRAEALFKNIVEGVKYAHDRGMIHRDLKPGNILITEEGVPKISDFGIARVLSERTKRNTMQGIALGTPQYMAPEQMRDAASVDHRADIFSLGVILYELLCNETPYKGSDPMSTMAAITSGMYKPIEEIRTGVPKYLRRVVESCLEPSKHQRPASCELILSMLDQGVQHLTAMGTLQTEEMDDESSWAFPVQKTPTPTPTPHTEPADSTTEEQDEKKQNRVGARTPQARRPGRSVWLYILLLLPAFAAFLGLTEELEGPLQYGLLEQVHDRPTENDRIVLMALQPQTDMKQLRSFHAEMVRKMVPHNPSAIVFDLNFSSASEHDTEFAAAIEHASENNVPVILPVRIVDDNAQFFSSEELGQHAQVGVVETNRDFDIGWVRRAPVYKETLNEGRLWHISTLAASAHMKSREPPTLNNGVLNLGNLRIPIHKKYLYLGAVAAPKQLPYGPEANLEDITDKIVVIGVTHGIDVHSTPFGPMYGPEVVGMFIETLLQQSAPRPLAAELSALLALFTGLIIAWLRQVLPRSRQWFALIGLAGALLIVVLLMLSAYLVSIIPVMIAGGIGWWLEKPYHP